MPMLFYVPPLLPVMGKVDNGMYENHGEGFFTSLDRSRMPIKYLAKLFSGGNEKIIDTVMKKLMAVRYYKRSVGMDDLDLVAVSKIMREANTTAEEAEEIYRLTALPTIDERFVIPEIQRERAIESTCSPELCKGSCGLGLNQAPGRGP